MNKLRLSMLMTLPFLLSACDDKSHNQMPSCQTVAEQIVIQEQNKPEEFFKRVVKVEQLSTLEQTEDKLLCRGIATLSDEKNIPIHLQALKHKEQWYYQMQRGSQIK